MILTGIPTEGLAVGEDIPLPAPIIEVPNLTVTSQNTYTAKAGEVVDIRVSLKNTSRYYATDISASINGDPTGTVYSDGSSYDSIRNLRDGSTDDLSFKVKVADSAEGGNYKLELNVTYYNDARWDETSKKYTLTETINIRVPKKTSKPQVLVSKVDIMPSDVVKPGEIIAVGFNLENVGEEIAKDVKISLEGLSSDGFTLAQGVNYTTVPSIGAGKSSYLYFELKSLKTIKKGSYELTLNLSYKDSDNEIISDKSTFFITSTAGEKENQSSLIIENLSYPTGTITRNTALDVKFTVRNKGKLKASNIIVKANSSDPSGVVPKSVSIVKIDSLQPGASQEINFEFLTTNSAETKNYPIELIVEYEDELTEKGEKHSFNQFVGVFSKAPKEEDPDDAKKYVPKLIIDKYNFEPNIVKAGETFELTLSFFNTNQSKSVRNIKIFLTSEPGSTTNKELDSGSVFTPVNSSNTFFIDSVSAKKTVEKKITMFTIPDALAKTHTITANLEYEDSEGNAYEAKELIGIPVVQKSKLEVGELNYFPDATVGEAVPLSVEFYNTGKSTLYNLMVKLEGDFQTENGQQYVGNFENGGSNYFDGTLIPTEAGELKGALVFTYEDSTGETNEVREEFSLNIMEMPPMDEFSDMDHMPVEKKSIFKSPWLWIIVIAGLVGGGIFLKKKKKEKKEKEMALDE